MLICSAAGQVVPQLHFHVIPVKGPEDEVRMSVAGV
jgi:diadenosine tetraphosphate (Ap4A) HIT family hydrolase